MNGKLTADLLTVYIQNKKQEFLIEFCPFSSATLSKTDYDVVK